jgi:hypothetical protein
MATAQSITTEHYKLFPSPRNLHRLIFEHEVFVPHPYMLIDMDSYYLKVNSACSPPAVWLTTRWASWSRSSCRRMKPSSS